VQVWVQVQVQVQVQVWVQAQAQAQAQVWVQASVPVWVSVSAPMLPESLVYHRCWSYCWIRSRSLQTLRKNPAAQMLSTRSTDKP
jgi:hypothetical protein